MEALVAPAWLVALASAFWLGAKAVITIKSGGNGHSASLPELRQHFAQQTSTLAALAVTLTTLTERLAHLPTKTDLVEAAKENRHDTRTNLRELGAGISTQLTQTEGRLRELIILKAHP